MLGAITGDIVGSVYEWNNIKTTDFSFFREDCFFTDDTVMTVAVADWLLNKGSLVEIMQKYGNRYPDAGYGGMFTNWLVRKNPKPYFSWGNGSAMRVSPAGWLFASMEETMKIAKQTAEVTHDHPEGIKGAQAVAACIFMARTGESKEAIKRHIESVFNYDLSRSCDQIRPDYTFDVSCQGTVPEAITAFLESKDFESAIRLAISLGGDSDTLACITGSIAEAFYDIPQWIRNGSIDRLTPDLKLVLLEFEEIFQK